ncbi:unnamed protein product, partial [Staurois parvus]
TYENFKLQYPIFSINDASKAPIGHQYTVSKNQSILMPIYVRTVQISPK